MKARILTDEVHASCGGKIRERVYANSGEGTPRQLECLECGQETAVFGTLQEPEHHQIRTVPADTYGGHIV